MTDVERGEAIAKRIIEEKYIPKGMSELWAVELYCRKQWEIDNKKKPHGDTDGRVLKINIERIQSNG